MFLRPLTLGGQVYGLAWCFYTFHQHVDARGRPRSKVRKGPVHLELSAMEDCGDLLEWAIQSQKALSGKIVFTRADTDAPVKHLWFTHAFCTRCTEDFNSTGTTGLASLRLLLAISPEDMGVEAGGGETWVAPPARAYAYVPPVPVAPPAVAVANPALPLPPHLPAPIPNPSPDHKQVHLSAQQWQDMIKDRWERNEASKKKKFTMLKEHRMTEFTVAGDPFTYRVDERGKVVAVYDALAQKSYNVTGTRKGVPGIPLTLSGEPTFAGTPHMYPVTGKQKNVVVIEMQGNRDGDFLRANREAGLLDVVQAQGLENHKP
ncbi:MAG TPA: type VI secretion system tube protein TssD, partial [Hymenobacter sp.]|nr:type VI secretion system tube protein TssD [Hymenobacter sp.]